ncbi:EAL domain-containing protein [Klebsiella pneumoniae]|uniref:EAL domain-containing protein n=1 Tax=Klebsiella pneumoniae TaxID=573 RepID=UPI0039192947
MLKLKGAGINLTIDHFGAEFARISLLAQYQPDRIKIDHELIRNIHPGRTAPVDCTGDYQMLYFSQKLRVSSRRR